MNKRIAIIGLLALLGACSRSVPPAEVVYDIPPTTYHLVKKEDSVANIARLYNMEQRELIRLNGLKYPYRLIVGQRLLVVRSGATLQPAEVPQEEEELTDGKIQVMPLEPPEETAIAPVEVEVELEKPEKAGLDEEDLPQLTGRTTLKPQSSGPLPQRSGQMIWPVQGKILKDFSSKGGKRGNDGINIAAPKGSRVIAADNGVVARSGNQLRGFGNFILIKHADGYMTVYTHLDTISVKEGEPVKRGQQIGTVGSTGQAQQPQIHFEVRRGKTPIDPKSLLA